MDEALELIDLAADLGLSGAITWVLRLIGLLMVIAGIAVLVLTELPVVVPAALVAIGLLLLVVPSVVLIVAEAAG